MTESGDETTSKSKNEANAQVQSNEAGGSNESSETREQITGGINTSVHPTDPSISFDFLLNISARIADEAKIKSALAKSVEVEIQKIQDFKITDLGNQSKELVRVTGQMITVESQLRTLEEKFGRLVANRVLSGKLKEELGLEERPRVLRFYSHSSASKLPSLSTSNSMVGDGASGSTTNSPNDTSNANMPSQNNRAHSPGDIHPTASLRFAKPLESGISAIRVDQSGLRPPPTTTTTTDTDPNKDEIPNALCCVVL